MDCVCFAVFCVEYSGFDSGKANVDRVQYKTEIVYPKGQKTITESTVRTAGLKAGLTDIKVVGFSATHTALKFVIPKAKR